MDSNFAVNSRSLKYVEKEIDHTWNAMLPKPNHLQAIERWMQTIRKNPFTESVLDHLNLAPNYTLLSYVGEDGNVLTWTCVPTACQGNKAIIGGWLLIWCSRIIHGSKRSEGDVKHRYVSCILCHACICDEYIGNTFWYWRLSYVRSHSLFACSRQAYRPSHYAMLNSLVLLKIYVSKACVDLKVPATRKPLWLYCYFRSFNGKYSGCSIADGQLYEQRRRDDSYSIMPHVKWV